MLLFKESDAVYMLGVEGNSANIVLSVLLFIVTFVKFS